MTWWWKEWWLCSIISS